MGVLFWSHKKLILCFKRLFYFFSMLCQNFNELALLPSSQFFEKEAEPFETSFNKKNT